jgi:hypothetical protein
MAEPIWRGQDDEVAISTPLALVSNTLHIPRASKTRGAHPALSLLGNGQSLAASQSSTRQDLSSGHRPHPRAKPVNALTASNLRLIRSLHVLSPAPQG